MNLEKPLIVKLFSIAVLFGTVVGLNAQDRVGQPSVLVVSKFVTYLKSGGAVPLTAASYAVLKKHPVISNFLDDIRVQIINYSKDRANVAKYASNLSVILQRLEVVLAEIDRVDGNKEWSAQFKGYISELKKIFGLPEVEVRELVRERVVVKKVAPEKPVIEESTVRIKDEKIKQLGYDNALLRKQVIELKNRLAVPAKTGVGRGTEALEKEIANLNHKLSEFEEKYYMQSKTIDENKKLLLKNSDELEKVSDDLKKALKKNKHSHARNKKLRNEIKELKKKLDAATKGGDVGGQGIEALNKEIAELKRKVSDYAVKNLKQSDEITDIKKQIAEAEKFKKLGIKASDEFEKVSAKLKEALDNLETEKLTVKEYIKSSKELGNKYRALEKERNELKTEIDKLKKQRIDSGLKASDKDIEELSKEIERDLPKKKNK